MQAVQCWLEPETVAAGVPVPIVSTQEILSLDRAFGQGRYGYNEISFLQFLQPYSS